MSPASQAPASPTASDRLRPDPSFTRDRGGQRAAGAAWARPGVRGPAEALGARRGHQHVDDRPGGALRCPPLTRTARSCSASISHRPVASASSAVATRPSGQRRRLDAVGGHQRRPPEQREELARRPRPEGPPARGRQHRIDDDRSGVVAERLDQRGGGGRADRHPDLHRRRPERSPAPRPGPPGRRRAPGAPPDGGRGPARSRRFPRHAPARRARRRSPRREGGRRRRPD